MKIFSFFQLIKNLAVYSFLLIISNPALFKVKCFELFLNISCYYY